MKSLKKIINEEVAIRRIVKEVGYSDGMDADLDTIAEYFIDEVGNLDDTVAIKNFFVKNQITDLRQREEILKLANKKLKGK